MKLKIGIPNGSMVNPKRGGLKELLDRARIYTKNIGTNKPPEIINIPWLEAVVGRPQELPDLASAGYCDIFFCGDDWVLERKLGGKESEKILGLGIGKVKVVYAEKTKIDLVPKLIASEYVNIAFSYLQDSQADSEKECKIVRLGEVNPDEISEKERAVVGSYGATEAKVYFGIVDAVIDATQSGDTLRNYGLEIKKVLLESECSLYCSKAMKDDSWKMKKAERVAMMLEGALSAQGKDLVTFNISNNNLDVVLQYIRKNKLFADEETVIPGKRMSEITLELPTRNCDKPLIDIIGNLKDLGATAIEGTPLSYSIR